MAKFCMYCGKQNDDGAAFCTSCGKQFPVAGSSTASSSSQAYAPSSSPASTQTSSQGTYVAELGPGAHKHMLTDVYLKDPAGNTVLVARLQSLLHRNYTIVDDKQATVGFIEEKTHLTHRTFTLQDQNKSPLAAVNVSNVEKGRGIPPNSWVEDGSGNRVANVAFTVGMLTYAAVKADGTTYFEAAASFGGGYGKAWEGLTKRSYSIRIDDPSMTLPLILTVVAALDQST